MNSKHGDFVRKTLICLFAGLTMLIAPSAALALKVDYTEFTLQNGMQVIAIPDRRAPVVTHMVWYRVGAADEISGKTGLAHFLEHLMFKGTKKHLPGDFDRILSINGGDGNAFTTQDATAYFQRIASDRLGLVMELEADRMQNLVLTDENVLPELEVVREERRQRTDNEPSALLNEQMDAALYTVHPYGRPVIGWMSEVQKLTREDALAFYRAHYTPANAVLVVAGDADPAEVKQLAEKYYGSLKNTFEPKPRVRTPEPEPIAARRIEMKDARVTSTMMQRVYLVPSLKNIELREAQAISLLADILGSGSQSRIYRKLVVEQKIAAYAGAYYRGTDSDSGTFGFYAAPASGKSVAEVEAAIDAIIAEISDKGVTQVELDRARKRSAAEEVYALDDTTALARMAGIALTTGISFDKMLDAGGEVEKVTIDDIKSAAVRHLQLKASVTGTLAPDRQATN
jgi:zinc protease